MESEQHRDGILEALRKSEREKWAILEGLNGFAKVRYLDRDYRIVWTNADEIVEPKPGSGIAPENFCYRVIQGRTEPCPNCEARDAFKTGVIQEGGELRRADGRCFIARGIPVRDETRETQGVIHIAFNITKQKETEEGLRKSEDELKRKSQQLGEMNTTLRVLLDQREQDQKELEARIVSNVKQLVLPYIHKLKGMHLSEAQLSYLEVAETHLNDIVAPFLRQMVSHHPGLTAKELQVATLVRQGRGNKEIAGLMNVSVNAIEIHRYNLRRKLGLQNRKINLRSYLLSLGRFPTK